MTAMASTSGRLVAAAETSCSSGRSADIAGRYRAPGRRLSRRQLRAFNTIVGPDPRLSSKINSSTVQLLNNGQKLHGREVEEAAMWQCIETHSLYPNGISLPKLRWTGGVLEEAYRLSGDITAEYAKTFYLGTQLMTPKQAKAIWAIYVWCRRTDELVDGPNASRITPKALDRWEERLEAIFEGRPFDSLDAALSDTIAQFPVHIQPFRDMIDGMRMDLVRSRYETYDELYEYCYRVAGTVALMTTPVMGVDPRYKGPLEHVYRAALALGTANQLTNILRDVGEDAQQRNRIYVPLEDLDRFGITEAEILNGVHVPSQGKVADKWRQFMKFQIERTRQVFKDAEAGVDLLDQAARFPVWSALIMYSKILDSVEANDYDNFSMRAYVPKWKKYASLPEAFLRSRAEAPLVASSSSSRVAAR